MEIVLGVASAIFILSLVLNIALIIRCKHLKKHPPAKQTYDATALMHDITAGAALVRIVRVNPGDVFVRSPKDRE